MQIHTSAYYCAAVPDGHPVIALAGELDDYFLVYRRLTPAQKASPAGKQIEGRMKILSGKCDVMLFKLFPELGEIDKRFDRLTPKQQEQFRNFAFDLYNDLADRECGL